MATRSKAPKNRKPDSNRPGIVGGEQKSGDTAEPPAATRLEAEEKSAPTIRKGIYLSALVYVEGDMPAPEDFIGPATAALKDALYEAFKSDPGGLTMVLKKVEVQNDIEQAEDDNSARGEKFQF